MDSEKVWVQQNRQYTNKRTRKMSWSNIHKMKTAQQIRY